MTKRVHEIAAEVGVHSQTILARLAHLGMPHLSASSPVSPELARRLTETSWNEPLRVLPAVSGQTRNTSGNRIYRGPALHPLEKGFLNRVIVPPRVRDRRAGGRGQYFEDEVATARELSRRWGGLIDHGMTVKQIVDWSQVQLYPRMTPGKALALHENRVQPDEVGWHYRDRGQGTLADRYITDKWTLSQVLGEIEWRREHPE